MTTTPAPTLLSVLQALPRARLLELGRDLDVPLDPEGGVGKLAGAVAGSGRAGLQRLVEALGRDELKAALRAHGLPTAGRSRIALAARLLGVSESALAGHPPIVPDAPPRRGYEIVLRRLDGTVQASHRWLATKPVASSGSARAGKPQRNRGKRGRAALANLRPHFLCGSIPPAGGCRLPWNRPRWRFDQEPKAQ